MADNSLSYDLLPKSAAHELARPFAISMAALTVAIVAALSTVVELGVQDDAHVSQYYTFLQSVLVMVFLGFGLLMTFLRRYSYGAIGFNFFASSAVMVVFVVVGGAVQQVIAGSGYRVDQGDGALLQDRKIVFNSCLIHLSCVTRLPLPLTPPAACAACPPPAHTCPSVQVFTGPKRSTILVDLPLLIDAAFAAGAAMISFGAVLGKTSPTQLLWLLVLQVPVYAINAYMVGALSRPPADASEDQPAISAYHSDIGHRMHAAHTMRAPSPYKMWRASGISRAPLNNSGQHRCIAPPGSRREPPCPAPSSGDGSLWGAGCRRQRQHPRIWRVLWPGG
jgi:hypothetical protein